MTYKVGDMIVHPLHGAGSISEIENKRINGKSRSYYVLVIPRGEMRVMIPTDTCEQIGIRPIITKEQATATLKLVNVIDDEELISYAHEDARALLAADPHLDKSENRALLGEIQRVFAQYDETTTKGA